MSRVCLCIPSRRPLAEVGARIQRWFDMGYHVAVAREPEHGPVPCHMMIPTWRHLGWGGAVDLLALTVLAVDCSIDWIVTGGDDGLPDPNKRADEIAESCSAMFGGTFGVMQPVGDRWGLGACATCAGKGEMPASKPITIDHTIICRHCHGTGQSAYIDRVAGSPWLGREFCERMYHGGGPIYRGYFHMFDDQELQTVAERLGVFAQRPDLTHKHEHWARPRADRADMPAWAAAANSPEQWARSQALFERRKAAGFPGHEPLEKR